jgi:hypothetical protein
MLEHLNYGLFYLINATPASPEWMIDTPLFCKGSDQHCSCAGRYSLAVGPRAR